MSTREVAHFPTAAQPTPPELHGLVPDFNPAAKPKTCSCDCRRSWRNSASCVAFGLCNVERRVEPNGLLVRQ